MTILKDRSRKVRRMAKRRRELIEAVSDFIAENCWCKVADRQSILQALEELKHLGRLTTSTVYVGSGGEDVILDVDKVMDFIAEADGETVKTIVSQVNKQVSKMEMEAEWAEHLERILNQNAPAGVESEVIELVQFFKNHWGIKVRIGANTYLLEFEGTLKQLEQELLRLRREQEADIVTCPFCGAQYIRAFAMKYVAECSCGAQIIHETSKDAATGHSPEVEKLWVEGCSALGLHLPPNRHKLHIDEYFENVRYAGRGTTSWRMWFVRKPWRLKRL